ncbi:hypothetical protein SAMN02799631_00608 [Methylobacterium sp. 174MFSha1.1]|uniref:hypothetical protein n=1 Tax=Methylobacterium sp. 174MFSha1.1 TaxID=1502749 RepID=UPI0008E1507B|nr:hypothetical protein [Methylobacterium sp. 174MFSha1.1]SFU42259.1 hypothetical protein SAMN02799631_00608 [Methylobacterium sp. 174MFSha1.1]
MPTPLPVPSDAPLFLHLAGSLAFVAVAGRGIGWALDAWVRRAPGAAPPAEPEPADRSGEAPAEAPPHTKSD